MFLVRRAVNHFLEKNSMEKTGGRRRVKHSAGLWRLVFRRFKRHRSGMIGLGIVLAMVFIAIFAPFIAPYPYDEQNFSERLQPPSLKHPFGTDPLGRDVFSRVVYGSRISIFIGLVITLLTAVIGITLGLIAGYFGGIVDAVISKVAEIFWAFPIIVFALAIVAAIGPSVKNVILVLGILMWVSFTKVVRAETLSIRERMFIKAAKVIGENNFKIIIRHVLPNAFPSIIVLATLTVPDAILTSAALSFLGLGVQPPTPEWGAILSDGRLYLRLAPWITIFPGIALFILVLGFNFMGDGLRDALDPLMRRR